MKKILLEDALILSAIRFGRFWVRFLPRVFSYAFARMIGWAVYWTGKRRHEAYRNLRMAFASEKKPAEMKRIAQRSIQSIALSAVDMLRIPDMTREDVERRFTIEGRENFEPYLQKGQGVLFMAGHLGSWELLGIASSLLGYPTAVLARVQKHPRSDAYLNVLRRSKGSRVIHKGMPVREILRALKSGWIVGIVADQDGGKNGRFVNFFNRLSSSPNGAAVFSLRTGAPICPLFITREPHDRHRIVVDKALEMPPADWPADRAETHLLQQFTTALETKIRQAPGQWLWSHRRWKSSPDRRVLVLSDGKAGHVNQSLAVLEALRRERRASATKASADSLREHGGFADRVFSETVPVEFKSAARQKAVRFLSLLFGGHLPLRRFWMKLILEGGCYRKLLHSYADIVLSCGSSLVDVNLWIKNENRARSVVVMKPTLPAAHFDAVIAPRHDRLANRPGVFTTQGALSSHSGEDLEVEAAALAAELGLEPLGRRVGVLVGGDTISLRFDPARFESLVLGLRAFARRSGAQLLVTTSRRTPAWAESVLRTLLNEGGLCPLLLLANESNRAGAVAGILGLSDALLVTAESMSMTSEAVSTGKPVLVARPWHGAGLKAKHEDFLRRLEKDRLIRVCEPADLEGDLGTALSGAWSGARDYRSKEEAVLREAAKKVMG